MIHRRKPLAAWPLLVFCGLAVGCAADELQSTAEVATMADAGPDQAVEDAPPAEDTQLESTASGWLPKATSELYGGWENQAEGVVRRYEFRFLDNGFADLFNLTPVYRLYRGEGGLEPELLERGSFKLGAGPVLQTTPQWALDPATVGKVRKVAFVPAQSQGTFELEVVPGVARVFVKVASFDFP